MKNIASEETFLHEYARYLLCKRLRTEGMISLCANTFYPQTRITSKTTENDDVRRNLNIDRNEIARQLNKDSKIIALKEETLITDEKDQTKEQITEEKCNTSKPTNAQLKTHKSN